MTADDWAKGFLDPFGLTWVAGGVSAMKEAFTPADTDDDSRPRRTGAGAGSESKRTSSGTDKRTSSGTDKKTSSGTDYAPDDYAPSGYAPSMPETTSTVEGGVSPWLIAGGLVAVVAAIAYVGTRK